MCTLTSSAGPWPLQSCQDLSICCFLAVQIMSFGPGQYFGENALLDNYNYNASAVARGRAAVLRASKADFNMVSNLNL